MFFLFKYKNLNKIIKKKDTFFSSGIGAAGFRCGVRLRLLVAENALNEELVVDVVDIRRDDDVTGEFCVELFKLLHEDEEPPAAAVNK